MLHARCTGVAPREVRLVFRSYCGEWYPDYYVACRVAPRRVTSRFDRTVRPTRPEKYTGSQIVEVVSYAPAVRQLNTASVEQILIP